MSTCPRKDCGAAGTWTGSSGTAGDTTQTATDKYRDVFGHEWSEGR